jgi:hypothetical protein
MRFQVKQYRSYFGESKMEGDWYAFCQDEDGRTSYLCKDGELRSCAHPGGGTREYIIADPQSAYHASQEEAQATIDRFVLTDTQTSFPA